MSTETRDNKQEGMATEKTKTNADGTEEHDSRNDVRDHGGEGHPQDRWQWGSVDRRPGRTSLYICVACVSASREGHALVLPYGVDGLNLI